MTTMTEHLPAIVDTDTLHTSDYWIAQGNNAVLPTYKRFPLVFERGQGVQLFDVDGKRYLDFVAGVAVNTLGHAHPDIVGTIQKQASQLMHCSNLYWTPQQIELAQKLTALAGMKAAFFCNSGAEAVEAALKLARRYYSRSNSDSPRTKIIAMLNGFHGRTMGSLSATGQLKYQDGFKPLIPDIVHVPFNDIDALKAVMDDKTAAVILEPIQGEGGVQPADVDYLKAVRELCNQNDTLLIFDEVQCGIGRTGKPFAWQQSGVKPDVMTLAKGLGAGFPIGALVVSDKCAQSLQPGEHGSTFGGNPLACSVALTVLKTLESADFLSHVEKRGTQLKTGLEALQDQYSDLVKDVRGQGLMLGLALKDSDNVAKLVSDCMKHGLLLVGAGSDVIRFVPPLIVSEAEIKEALGILDRSLESLRNS
jgi:acetylornithine/N-succinyldiaminopimelate aminotransferase